MRWSRAQFTVRRLVLLVVLVAALLGAFEAGRRWERRAGERQRAKTFLLDYYEALLDVDAKEDSSQPQGVPDPPKDAPPALGVDRIAPRG